MKKFVSIVLVAVLCFAFCVPALAASGTAEAAYTGQTSSEEVKITINGEVIHVYYVEIEFTSNPVFVYSSGSKWNPDTYQYEPNSAAEWAGDDHQPFRPSGELRSDIPECGQHLWAAFY